MTDFPSSPVTARPDREAIAKAIHEGLGGDGWAYSNYGRDEWNDKRDALLAAADAAIQCFGFAQTPAVLEALKLAEDVLSRSPFSTDIWPNGMHPNTGINKIRDAIKSLADTSTVGNSK
jgi:hypothetical protein